MSAPVEVNDIFVHTLKHFVEPRQYLNMVLTKLFIAILQILYSESIIEGGRGCVGEAWSIHNLSLMYISRDECTQAFPVQYYIEALQCNLTVLESILVS